MAKTLKRNARGLRSRRERSPKERPRKPGPRRRTSQLALVAKLRKRLARALETIEGLKLRTEIDFLLDIPNRRAFEREVRRAAAYLRRYGATAAVLFLDVDRLKSINDRLGHLAGDAALKAIARQLVGHVRASDVVGRIGGDEFGVLLWNLNEDDAATKAGALEAAVDGSRATFRGHRLALGVSVGFAMLRADDEVADVLARADQAMYLRKQVRRVTSRKLKR
jgi:diguanylate cyclase (GGDEF)-like protein